MRDVGTNRMKPDTACFKCRKDGTGKCVKNYLPLIMIVITCNLAARKQHSTNRARTCNVACFNRRRLSCHSTTWGFSIAYGRIYASKPYLVSYHA